MKKICDIGEGFGLLKVLFNFLFIFSTLVHRVVGIPGWISVTTLNINT